MMKDLIGKVLNRIKGSLNKNKSLKNNMNNLPKGLNKFQFQTKLR